MKQSRKNRKNLPAVVSQARQNLPAVAGTLIASVHNDITIPFFNGNLAPADDTLLQRGGGKGLKLYDEIERDTHAYAMLQKRKKALLSRDWEVRPASDAPRDMEAADLVRGILANLPFDRVCEDLLDATLKGFAISEVVWGRDNGRLVPARIVSHDQRRFAFDREWKPRLLTLTNMVAGEVLPERKFIIHRFGVKGNNPYGLGLGSRMFWAVLFKREGVAFWLHFLEKFASPTVVGKTPYASISEEQVKLLNTLRSVRGSSAITVPLGTELEFLEASRSGSVSYEQFLTYWDKQISICVNGETLTTDVGKSGSRAASQTHADMLEMSVDADADLLSDTLRETLCQWIVDYNLPGARAPSIWRTRPENEESIALTRQAKAKAAMDSASAIGRVMRVAGQITDEQAARAFLIGSGAFDHYDDGVVDYFVNTRTKLNLPDAGPSAAPGVPSGAPPDPAQDDPVFAADGSKKNTSALPMLMGRLCEAPTA